MTTARWILSRGWLLSAGTFAMAAGMSGNLVVIFARSLARPSAVGISRRPTPRYQRPQVQRLTRASDRPGSIEVVRVGWPRPSPREQTLYSAVQTKRHSTD